MKNVIKEFFIMIVILIIMVIALGLMFYDYMPLGKVIPNKVAYKIPEEIAKELEEYTIEEKEQERVVYELTGDDLKNYEKGKVNPFTPNTTNSVENTNTTTNEVKSNTDSLLENLLVK